MNQPYYPFDASTNRLSFVFESINNGRKITKAVEYVPFPFDKRIYNLAFGDINENGELDDLSVSDNQDMEKVLATVIQTIFVFFRTYPDKTLFFTGSTNARTRLYRGAIGRVIDELQEGLLIEGIRNNNRELFQKNVTYEAFLISLKPEY